MNLELLSCEIFFEIFDFLDDIHIIHAFHNLNYRFNDLVLTYFRVYPRLNLQSITKIDFIMTCQHLIPLLTDKIQSLHLSNDDNTPQQIDLFFSYGLSLHEFIHLKSLSLYNMHSEQIINRMMIEWQYPIHLTHLNIIHCRMLDNWNIFYLLINNIWSLPKLTHCQLDINVVGDNYSFVPTVISLTLNYLSIKNIYFDFKELIHLFEHTPYLQYLDITIIEENIDHPYMKFSVPLLKTLKLDYEGQTSALRNLLQNVPNLYHWSMKTKNTYVDGQEWAEIIRNHLSRLKVFHLLMEFDNEDHNFSLKDFLQTYTSGFWLNERRWYVQGDRYECQQDCVVLAYTLPCTFNDYIIPSNYSYSRMKSYSSNFQDEISCDHVHYLSCDTCPKFQFRNRFSQLHHLSIILPQNNQFWTIVPTFDQLQKLDISLSYKQAYDGEASYQLQVLLEGAPKLTSLTIKSSIGALLPLLECTSKSIVQLNLQTYNEYFNHSDCDTLLLSSLGKQCKILSIAVIDRMNILQLIQEMPELQTLNVEDPFVIYDKDLLLPGNDQLIKWLQYKLPSTYTITRDPILINQIHIWIC